MQDSDGAQGQVSPNSAMSISPASSEVGSCLNRAASTSIVASNRESSKNNQCNTSSKHYKSNKGNKPHHRIRNRDRSDLDLDWRRSTTSGGNTTTTTTSGGGSSSSHHASKTMSADEDPDWRNHKSVEKNNDACTTTTSSNKPSKFKGRCELRTITSYSKLNLKQIFIHQFIFSLFFSFFFTFEIMKIMNTP